MDVAIRSVTFVSSIPAMLENAGALLSLADSHSEHKKTLAACASLILAAALDQGTWTVLSSVIAQSNESVRPQFDQLKGESLRRRVIRLPEALTSGKFRLNPRTAQVQALHELITLRNELMHVTEEVEVKTMSVPWPIAEDQNISISPTLPEFKWFSVTAEQATGYREAVELYVEEVLFPSSGEIRRGRIVGALE